jgi:sugar/nucleoside kinase (ribokinase family)
MRGETHADATGLAAKVVDTTGAGDLLRGVLVAALAGSRFDPAAAARTPPLTLTTAARSAKRYGAFDALASSVSLSTTTYGLTPRFSSADRLGGGSTS